MSVDLTVVVTAHDETAVCGPTLRAADLAVEAARQLGRTVQTIVCLDAPTEATSAYFDQSHFQHWERREIPVSEYDGRYLTILTADDLVSENWLAEGIAALDAAAMRGERVIVHPELEVTFDGRRRVQLNIDQDSPLFTPHFLCFGDYYQSPGIAPREAHLEQPYDGVEFTVETMAAGWRHVVVRDTVLFKRSRELPGDPERDGRTPIGRELSATAIDRIRNLG